MVRHTFWAVLACPLLLALACGDDEDPFDSGSGGAGHGSGGAQSEGGVAGENDAGGNAGAAQAGSSSGGANPEGGHAGAPSTGGITSGGSGGTTSGGSGGATNGGSGGTTSGGSGGTTSGGSGGTTNGGSGGTGGVNPEGGSTSGGMAGGEGGGGGGGDAGAGGEQGLVLTVTTNADVRAISPLIYGINANGVACSDAKGNFTLCRLGGNRWSTYNWENNASNAGADSGGCSLNNDVLGASDTPGLTVTEMIEEADQKSATAVVTIPMLDSVAADKFTEDLAQCLTAPKDPVPVQNNPNLRVNRARKGSPFVYPPNAADATVSQDEFVDYLHANYSAANLLFTLDNQPELWGQTHKMLHPATTTYQEVITRSVEYASMIKQTWPGAEVTGSGGYGYLAFTSLQWAPGRPDSEFIDYYLSQMKLEGDKVDERLLDYLDVHWYSDVDADGLIASLVASEGTPALAAARVQATRSLFETDYVEPSWIGRDFGAIRLIPWLRDKIATRYSGTKLAISSWGYGGEDVISGAIAVADALGIYGREGVDMAALDPNGQTNAFAVGGMSIYRNYDGAGATFGNRSVRAVSNDPTNVTVYASTDSAAAGRVVIVAINKNTQALTATLEVNDSHTFTAANVHVLTSASAVPLAAAALTATSANHFEYSLPGSSISVIVPHS